MKADGSCAKCTGENVKCKNAADNSKWSTCSGDSYIRENHEVDFIGHIEAAESDDKWKLQIHFEEDGNDNANGILRQLELVCNEMKKNVLHNCIGSR